MVAVTVTSSYCDNVELQDPERQLDGKNLSGTRGRTPAVCVGSRHHTDFVFYNFSVFLLEPSSAAGVSKVKKSRSLEGERKTWQNLFSTKQQSGAK
jgi:hypothetical protein